MKSLRCLPALLLVTVLAAFAADDGPQFELRAIVAAGGHPRFGLATPGGGQTAWVTVGDTFGGWILSDYRAGDDTLVFTKDGRTATVRLSTSVVGVSPVAGNGSAPMTENTRATLADAEEVLNKMKFDQMIERTLKLQKDSMATMVKQLAAQAGGPGATAEQQAFQTKLMDTVLAELNANAMRGDIARAYSEVYSKEELQAIASFYSSPAGQAMADKAPEVAAKTQAAMLPRLMAATSKAQQMAKDFAVEQAAKKVAGPAK